MSASVPEGLPELDFAIEPGEQLLFQDFERMDAAHERLVQVAGRYAKRPIGIYENLLADKARAWNAALRICVSNINGSRISDAPQIMAGRYLAIDSERVDKLNGLLSRERLVKSTVTVDDLMVEFEPTNSSDVIDVGATVGMFTNSLVNDLGSFEAGVAESRRGKVVKALPLACRIVAQFGLTVVAVRAGNAWSDRGRR